MNVSKVTRSAPEMVTPLEISPPHNMRTSSLVSSPHGHTMRNCRMSLHNKCRIRPVVWLPPRSYALVVRIDTERFIAENHAPTVSHSLAFSRSVKIQSTLLMMGSVAEVLIVVVFLYLRQRMIPFDTTACLKGGVWCRNDSNDVFGEDVVTFMMARSTDEAHFWLNGYVNKQNCRIWSEVNPQVYVETPLHPETLIV
ncbi:hypothetical protein TNCV_3851201 [Trichonephila clavipes]|nr:hypothetical protein TNCV_3851201 [Trichonephila clavipes]